MLEKLTQLLLSYLQLPFQVTFALMVSVGSAYGTSASVFAILCIYVSFFIFAMGFCAMLGAVLDARTAFIATLILPYFFAIFGQGNLTKSFANIYPACIGQVISGLMINDLNQTEWLLYGVSIFVNLLLGSLFFYIFLVRLGNYNPFAKCCSEKDADVVEKEYDWDIEEDGGRDESVFLEGRSLVKTYGVGENDAASFRALDDVTFAVENGSLLGLVGKSGAGVSL